MITNIESQSFVTFETNENADVFQLYKGGMDDLQKIISSNQLYFAKREVDTIPIKVDAYYRDRDSIKSTVISDNGNILKYHEYHLVDGNLLKSFQMKFPNKNFTPGCMIVFEEVIPVNKIVIYNGYQKSTNMYMNNSRVRKFAMTVYNVYKRGGKKVKEFGTNFILPDSPMPYELFFPEAINAIYWDIGIRKADDDNDNVYIGEKYDDVAISEIEFWYEDKLYEIVNIEEWEENFKTYRRGIAFTNKTMFLHAVYSPLSEIFNTTIFNLGFDPDSYTCFQFRDNDYGIYLYKKDELYMLDEDGTEISILTNNGHYIGEWKIDEYGNTWIKVINGEWKMEDCDADEFLGGTDLETDYAEYEWMEDNTYY